MIDLIYYGSFVSVSVFAKGIVEILLHFKVDSYLFFVFFVFVFDTLAGLQQLCDIPVPFKKDMLILTSYVKVDPKDS